MKTFEKIRGSKMGTMTAVLIALALATVFATGCGVLGTGGEKAQKKDTLDEIDPKVETRSNEEPTVSSTPASEPAPIVRITSGIFSESAVLAEVYAQALEGAGYDVVRGDPFGGTLPCEVVEGGEADVVPAYSPSTPPDGAVELEPAPAMNDVVLVVRSATDEKFGVDEIADLDRVPGGRTKILAPDAEPTWVTGDARPKDDLSPPSCGGNGSSASSSASASASSSASSSASASAGAPSGGEQEGPTLKSVYGLSDVTLEDGGDPSIRFSDLAEGKAHAIEATSSLENIAQGYCPNGDTDGECPDEARLGFSILDDPERLVSSPESYHPVPVVREEWLEEHPDAADVLNEASKKLDLADLQALNFAVYSGDADISDAVARWREANGL